MAARIQMKKWHFSDGADIFIKKKFFKKDESVIQKFTMRSNVDTTAIYLVENIYVGFKKKYMKPVV